MARTPETLHGKSFEDYIKFLNNVVITQNNTFNSKLKGGVNCNSTETSKLNIIYYLLTKYSGTEGLDCIYNLRPFTRVFSIHYTTENALNTSTYLEDLSSYVQKHYK